MAILLGCLVGAIIGFFGGVALGHRDNRSWRLIGRLMGVGGIMVCVLLSKTDLGKTIDPVAILISAVVVTVIFVFPANWQTPSAE